jgi:hypothetical protein
MISIDNKQQIMTLISSVMSSINEVLCEKSKEPAIGKTNDADAIKDILKCYCRMLWNNHSLGKWVKEEQKLFIV